MTDWIKEIETLAGLRDSGALTDQEFSEAKARILQNSTQAPVPETKVSAPTRLKGVQLSEQVQVTGETAVQHPDATWNDFLNSDKFDEVIEHSFAYYRRKFTKIVENKGVGERSIIKCQEILSGFSFNVAALFFPSFWAAFRGITGWRYIIALQFLITLMIEASFELYAWASIALGLSIMMFGNAWYLKAAAEQWMMGAQSSGLNKSGPSFARVGLMIGANILALILSAAIFQ